MSQKRNACKSGSINRTKPYDPQKLARSNSFGAVEVQIGTPRKGSKDLYDLLTPLKEVGGIVELASTDSKQVGERKFDIESEIATATDREHDGFEPTPFGDSGFRLDFQFKVRR